MRDELLSVKAAAERRGVSPSTVQKWIDKKQLAARPIDDIVKGAPGWYIRARDLERFAPPPVGQPKKGKKRESEAHQ